jgi:hypothetical protein
VGRAAIPHDEAHRIHSDSWAKPAYGSGTIAVLTWNRDDEKRTHLRGAKSRPFGSKTLQRLDLRMSLDQSEPAGLS